MIDCVAIEPLPIALSWQTEPVDFRASGHSLWAEAGSETDLFVDPGTGSSARSQGTSRLLPE